MHEMQFGRVLSALTLLTRFMRFVHAPFKIVHSLTNYPKRFGLKFGCCDLTMKALHTTVIGLALVFATAQVATAQVATEATGTRQQARVAVGARIGSPMGVSGKAFLTENIAFELNGTVRNPAEYREVSINGGLFFYMTDHGFNSPMWRGVSLYGGLGLGRSYFKYDPDFLANQEEITGTNREGTIITVKPTYAPMSTSYKAYIGAQYLPKNLPLEFTLDFGPSITTGKVPNAIGGHASLGVRYIVFRQKAQG